VKAGAGLPLALAVDWLTSQKRKQGFRTPQGLAGKRCVDRGEAEAKVGRKRRA